MGAEIDRLEIAVEAQASKADAQLDKLVTKLEKLSNVLSGLKVEKIGNIGKTFEQTTAGASSASGSLRTLSRSMSEFSGNSTKAAASVKSFSQVWGSFYALVFPIVRGIKSIGRAIESSMDYIETYNYYNVTMDKIGKEFAEQYSKYGYHSADSYANSFSERLNELTKKMTGYRVGSDGVLSLTNDMNLGLDPKQMMEYQANVSAVTNSVGLMGETSINTAKALSMLAADMSSFKNVELSTVMTNFQSGLIGQSRALYKYGIDITNATLQTYAYKYGLTTAMSEMTQSDKMQLRLLAILDQSKIAWGDQANTLNSVANQYRILKQQISNVARMIGNILMPVIQAALPFINGLLIATQRLLSFVGGLLKIDFSKIMDGISSGYGGIDVGDLADDTSDVADNLGNAESNAKKLQRTILGFDQINKLNADSSSDKSSDGGAGGIDLSNEIAAALADYEAVWNKAFENSVSQAQVWADKISAAFRKVWDTAEPTRNAVVRLCDEGLAKLGDFSFDTLKDLWQNFLKPMGSWMLGDDSGLPSFFNITNNLLNEIDWGRLKSSLSDFYEALQKPAKFVWTGLMDFYEFFLKPVAVWTMGEGIPQLVDALSEFANTIHWGEINKALWNLWDALAPFAKSVGQGLIDFFKGLLKIGANFINKVVPGGLNGLADAIRKINPDTAERIGKALGVMAIGIMALKGIAGIVGGLAEFGAKIVGLKEGLGTLFGAEGIFAKMGGVIGNAKLLISGFFGKIAEVFTLTSGGAGTLCESFAAVFNVSLPLVAGIAAIGIGIIDLWKTSETFRDNVKNMLSIIGDAFIYAKQKIWNEGLKPLWDSIKELFGSLYEIYEESGLKDIFEAIVTAIGYVASTALGGLIVAISEFAKFLANKVQGMVDVLNTVLGFVKSFLAEHKETIDGLKQIFGGLTEFLAGAFSGDWKRAWNGIKEIFSGVWNTFVGIVKTPINKIIGILNSFLSGVQTMANAIAKALSFNVSLPKAMQKLTGMSSFSLNIPKVTIPKISYLASGGIVNSGEMFVARENGLTEMVGRIGNHAAVANNEQITEGIATAVQNAIAPIMADVVMAMNTGSATAPIVEVIIKADSETAYKFVKKGEEKANRRYQVVVPVT